MKEIFEFFTRTKVSTPSHWTLHICPARGPQLSCTRAAVKPLGLGFQCSWDLFKTHVNPESCGTLASRTRSKAESRAGPTWPVELPTFHSDRREPRQLLYWKVNGVLDVNSRRRSGISSSNRRRKKNFLKGSEGIITELGSRCLPYARGRFNPQFFRIGVLFLKQAIPISSCHPNLGPSFLTPGILFSNTGIFSLVFAPSDSILAPSFPFSKPPHQRNCHYDPILSNADNGSVPDRIDVCLVGRRSLVTRTKCRWLVVKIPDSISFFQLFTHVTALFLRLLRQSIPHCLFTILKFRSFSFRTPYSINANSSVKTTPIKVTYHPCEIRPSLSET